MFQSNPSPRFSSDAISNRQNPDVFFCISPMVCLILYTVIDIIYIYFSFLVGSNSDRGYLLLSVETLQYIVQSRHLKFVKKAYH